MILVVFNLSLAQGTMAGPLLSHSVFINQQILVQRTACEFDSPNEGCNLFSNPDFLAATSYHSVADIISWSHDILV